ATGPPDRIVRPVFGRTQRPVVAAHEVQINGVDDGNLPPRERDRVRAILVVAGVAQRLVACAALLCVCRLWSTAMGPGGRRLGMHSGLLSWVPALGRLPPRRGLSRVPIIPDSCAVMGFSGG